MSQIADIENALLQMNPARFQELGDLLVERIFPDTTVFACVGSQFGKEKTLPGTPDTYLETENQIVYVEYSTNVSSGKSKIKDDIDKCVNDIVNRKINKDALIIIIANFRISKDDQISIVEYAVSKGSKCKVFDGQHIARLIKSEYKDLAGECGVPIDTGQVVDIDIFMREYSQKGGQFAMTLSTKFMFREAELARITSLLVESDIVLITGAPGVGKTRIAVEAIRQFCQTEGYHSKCISYKEDSLLSDLNSNLVDSENYVIFVDDVNRVSNIGQIIGFQNSYRSGKIKLVLTVRNYAKGEISDILAISSFETVDIDEMSDENIIELVKVNKCITNEVYLNKIATIACGNSRLAMMAAEVAIKEQRLSSLSNLGKLFDAFYSELFKKHNSTHDRLLYNSLIIAAILGPFSMENSLLPSLCSVFNLHLEDFKRAVDDWINKEYIDRYSNGYYKIAEQNMGPYIFYTFIIKEHPELIETIFNICHGKQEQTLRENILTCSYLFGFTYIHNQISTYISNIFRTLPGREEKLYFLASYWALIVNDTIGYISSEINAMEFPKEATESYNLEYEHNEMACSSHRDRLLDLISEIFDYSIEGLGDVIQMAMEYVRRRPELAPQLIWSIIEHFSFTQNDHRSGFLRQGVLLETIAKNMEIDDILSKNIFWKIIGQLLKCEHHYTTTTFRNPRKFTICNLSIRESSPLTEMHKQIWSLMDCYFDKEAFSSFIKAHGFYAPKGSKFPKLDAYSVGEIINKHLSPDDFGDCLIVEEFINSIRYLRSCNQLKSFLHKRFNNDIYSFYNLLRWNYCKGKEEAKYDYQKYRQFKVKELASSFHFENKKDCDAFIRRFKSLITNPELSKKEPLYESVSFLIGHTLRRDISLGSHFFRQILRCITDRFDIGPMLYPLAYDDKHNLAPAICAIKDILQRTRNQHKFRMLIGYFAIVPSRYLVSNDLTLLLKSIRNYKSSDKTYISPSQFTKFSETSEDGFPAIMREFYLANQSEFKFHYSSNNIETWLNLISDRNLAELIYLQQVEHQDHFDYKRQAFLNLVNTRPHFLVDYVKVAKAEASPKINEVWAIKDIEPIVEEIMSMIRSRHNLWHGISKDWEYEMFSGINNQDNLKKAKNFIIERFRQSRDIEQTFRLARFHSNQLFNQLAIEYIDKVNSAQEYMEIDWINASAGITTVNQTLGEIVAFRWQIFLDVVKMSKSHKKYSIIAEIEQLIQQAKQSSLEENERDKLFR